MPWSRNNRRLKPTEEFSIEEMFEIVKHDVISTTLINLCLVIQMGYHASGHSSPQRVCI